MKKPLPAKREFGGLEITVREMRGISEEQFVAALSAARRLIEDGAERAGMEVLAGLVLYDPFRADVWREMEVLCRRKREPEAARLFCELGRALEG